MQSYFCFGVRFGVRFNTYIMKIQTTEYIFYFILFCINFFILFSKGPKILIKASQQAFLSLRYKIRSLFYNEYEFKTLAAYIKYFEFQLSIIASPDDRIARSKLIDKTLIKINIYNNQISSRLRDPRDVFLIKGLIEFNKWLNAQQKDLND